MTAKLYELMFVMYGDSDWESSNLSVRKNPGTTNNRQQGHDDVYGIFQLLKLIYAKINFVICKNS